MSAGPRSMTSPISATPGRSSCSTCCSGSCAISTAPSHVTYVRNITDVDDKINARAARDFPGLPLNEAIAKVTEATERQFHEDVAALGALPPTHEPRATQYIDTMRVMIERLIARGVAYVAEDHVLFSPSAMDALPWAPRYGTLAHRSLDEMLAGARVDVAPYKRDPMDFVLWKPSKPNEPGWPSPAGIARARASRLAYRVLGDVDGDAARAVRRRPCHATTRAATFSTFTAAGSISSFPTTRTRSRNPAAPCHSRMANVWMHNGFLQVEGEKMSKSLGNFVTIHELLRTTKFGGREWPGEVLRLAMLRTHYRQPIDWTVKALEEAEATLDRWYDAVGDVEARGDPDEDVLNALADDLNTPEAVARLHRLAHPDGAGTAILDPSGTSRTLSPEILKTSANLLGLLRQTRSERQVLALERRADRRRRDRCDHRRTRSSARAARNWAESDRLRDQLAALGVAIKDNKDGATTWELKR